MSLETFVRALPKVDLWVQLEGAMPAQSILNIAAMNEVADESKQFNTWANLVRQPEPKKAYDVARAASGWLRHSDDLMRIVYETGLALAKQGIVYAEVALSPGLYEATGASPDELFAAAAEGASRVRRAWGFEMAFIIACQRDEPRKAEDYVRFAAGPAARGYGVVGAALTGREVDQPAGQFERAFTAAHKREIPSIVRAGDSRGAEGVLDALEALAPDRLIDAHGLLESEAGLQIVVERGVTVALSPARYAASGWAASAGAVPVRALLDAGVRVVIVQDMPALLGANLNDAYLSLLRSGTITLVDLLTLCRNALHASLLQADQKQSRLNELDIQFAQLAEEHRAAAELPA